MTLEDKDTSFVGAGTFEPVLDNDAQLAALARAVQYAEEFALLFAVCNNNTLRSELMERLRENAPNKAFSEIALFEPVENLYTELTRRFGDEGRGGEKSDVVAVYGLEAWLPSGKEGENSAFIKNLNAARNHFPRVFDGPLILWLSDHHLEAIARGAPDFCSVRSGGFVFAATPDEEASMRVAIEVLGLDGVSGLPLADKKRRLEEIERMLAELQEQPEEKRDIQRERRLLQAAAEMYYVMSQYAKAQPLFRRLLEVDQALLGPDHPKVAIRLNNLAQLLKATNGLSEAEPLMRRALEIDEASYGPDHLEVATDLNNLATLLLATNRLSEAEPLMRRALVIDEASYGPDHPNVAIRLNNLAQLLKATNRLSEAEPLFRRALEISETSFGPNHPNVASYLNNLATLLLATNRLSEAEPLVRRALEIDEASFGPDHPEVAIHLNNLAMLLKDTNRLSEAEPLMRRNLEILLEFTRDVRHPHPHLRSAIRNYAGLLRDMGRSEEEIRKERDALLAQYGVDLGSAE